MGLRPRDLAIPFAPTNYSLLVLSEGVGVFFLVVGGGQDPTEVLSALVRIADRLITGTTELLVSGRIGFGSPAAETL